MAPFPGEITRVGVAYTDSDVLLKQLKETGISRPASIHLAGSGDFEGWEAKILYCEPDPGLGGRVVAMGDRLGEAQDVAGYWKAREPGHIGDMKQHVHLEIRVTRPTLIDPLLHFPANLVVQRPVTA